MGSSPSAGRCSGTGCTFTEYLSTFAKRLKQLEIARRSGTYGSRNRRAFTEYLSHFFGFESFPCPNRLTPQLPFYEGKGPRLDILQPKTAQIFCKDGGVRCAGYFWRQFNLHRTSNEACTSPAGISLSAPFRIGLLFHVLSVGWRFKSALQFLATFILRCLRIPSSSRWRRLNERSLSSRRKRLNNPSSKSQMRNIQMPLGPISDENVAVRSMRISDFVNLYVCRKNIYDHRVIQ